VLHLVNLEEIEAFLLKVPLLVEQFEERDPDFFPAVKSWLASVEDTLSKNRMPQTSEIAVCRSALISIERGFLDGAALQNRIGARKLREARASHMLKHATDVITETIRFRRGQIDEAGRVMMQIVAVADHLGLIPPDSGQSHSAYLQSILLAMSNRAELISLVVHVTGLLGKSDTLIVLDRSIANIRQ
jgi:hypothetical protein